MPVPCHCRQCSAGRVVLRAFPSTTGVPMSIAATTGTESRPAPLRVLLVDELAAVRAILRTALTRQALIPVEIEGEAENGHAAVEAMARCLPEVVIMDVEMPCLDGVETTRQIVRRFPAIRVIGWTICDEPTTEAKRSARRERRSCCVKTQGSPICSTRC